LTRDFQDYLSDIHRSMELAITFTSGMDLDDFVGDEKNQYAVIRCLLINNPPNLEEKS
jgi:uncharacterized protein with HEPN domain